MEISHVPHENQDLHCRVSRLETQLSQLLNDNLALQGQCDALTARVKFLVESLEISAASSIPKMVSSSNKCKKRRLDALSKAQSGLRTTTSCPQASRKKTLRSQLPPIGNFLLMLTLHPCPPTTLSQFPHHIPQTFPHPSPSLTNPVPSATQIPSHQTAHGGMYKENAVRKVRLKNLLPIYRSKIQGSRGTSA